MKHYVVLLVITYIKKVLYVMQNVLRFDFSHFEAVTAVELEQIEDMVNEQIRLNHEVVN